MPRAAIPADLSPRAYRRAAIPGRPGRRLGAPCRGCRSCRHEAKPGREPYEALVRAIAHQQLHARAAEAILARLLALYPDADFPSPQALLATDEQQQRACGLSASKLVAIRGIAQAAADGVVPSRADAAPVRRRADRAPDAAARGPQTVEMFLIYTLERSDILPVDDYGVREGYRRLKSLDKTPTPRQMRDIGLAWARIAPSPHGICGGCPPRACSRRAIPSEHRPGMHSHDRHRRHAGRQELDRHRP